MAAVFAVSPIGLAMFSAPQLVFGIPALALYLFGVWALIIVLLAGLASLGEASEVRDTQAAAASPDPPVARPPNHPTEGRS